MRRALSLLLVFCCVVPAMAQQLSRVSAAVAALGSYEVDYSMEVNGDVLPFEGRYIVDGDRYRLAMEGQTIVGDSTVRYTIDSVNREVVVEGVSSDLPMILSNPARAFGLLDESFTATLKSSGEVYYVLKLTPRRRDPILREAELYLSQASSLPLTVIYRSHEGDEIVIYLRNFAGVAIGVLPRDVVYPTDYELIDFR